MPEGFQPQFARLLTFTPTVGRTFSDTTSLLLSLPNLRVVCHAVGFDQAVTKVLVLMDFILRAMIILEPKFRTELRLSLCIQFEFCSI
jgi:hypothetical protein